MDARELLQEMYAKHGDLIAASNEWHDETDRWAEFVYATLRAGTNSVSMDLQRIVYGLNLLNLIDPEMLSRVEMIDGSVNIESPIFKTLLEVIVYNGIEREDAEKCIRAIIQANHSIRDKYDGRVQLLLNKHTNEMVKDLLTLFNTAPLTNDERMRAVKLWLQNAFDWPVLLPVSYVENFCKSRGVDFEELQKVAVEENLNLTSVDDLILLEEAVEDGP